MYYVTREGGREYAERHYLRIRDLRIQDFRKDQLADFLSVQPDCYPELTIDMVEVVSPEEAFLRVQQAVLAAQSEEGDLGFHFLCLSSRFDALDFRSMDRIDPRVLLEDIDPDYLYCFDTIFLVDPQGVTKE